MRPLLLFLLLSATESFAQTGLIDQPQTFPWSVGLTPVVQEEAGGLDEGAWRVKSSVLWFNTYRQHGKGSSMDQQIDMEGLLSTTSAAWSPASGWELRGQVQGWVLGGGVMDILVSGFHNVLFLPNQGRDEMSVGAYRDYLKGVFDETQPAAGLTQLSVGARAFHGPWSWTTWVKPPLPARRDWGWTDQWSAGTGAGWGDSFFWAGWNWGGGLSGALILVDADSDFPETTAGVTYQTGGYVIVAVPHGLRMLMQGTWTKVPRGGDGYLPQGAGLLTTGVQVPLGKPWTLEFAVTEEFLTWATMEVGFQLGLTWNP